MAGSKRNMNDNITILGSTTGNVETKFENEMLTFANAIKNKNVFYCGSNCGFLKKLISELIGNNIVTGYLCKEYASDVNPDLHNKKIYASEYIRLKKLIASSKTILIFPGGFGTASELFTLLNTAQDSPAKYNILLIEISSYWHNLMLQIRTMYLLHMVNNVKITLVKTAMELENILCTDTN